MLGSVPINVHLPVYFMTQGSKMSACVSHGQGQSYHDLKELRERFFFFFFFISNLHSYNIFRHFIISGKLIEV